VQAWLQWKKISIKYSQFVFVALVIQLPMRTLQIVNRGLSGSTVFIHIILQTARTSGKQVFKHEMGVLIFSANLAFSRSEKN
jgi:hypothetical protein